MFDQRQTIRVYAQVTLYNIEDRHSSFNLYEMLRRLLVCCCLTSVVIAKGGGRGRSGGGGGGYVRYE